MVWSRQNSIVRKKYGYGFTETRHTTWEKFSGFPSRGNLDGWYRGLRRFRVGWRGSETWAIGQRVGRIHVGLDGLGSLVWGPRVGGIRIDTTRRVLWTRKILGALSEARVGAHRGLLSPGRLPLVSPSSCWSAPERSACFERPVSRSRRSPVGRVSRAQLYLRHARQGLPRSSQVILTPHVCLLRGRASSLVVTA